jgi:DivIVA domain-containing protein
MAEEDTPRRTSPGPGRLTPEEVANRTFSHQFRGVSDTEVRNYLRRVSDELLRLRTTETDLRGRIEALEGQIKNPPAPTEQQLLESLGEETARVLRSANEAAEEIRSKAEARAGLLVSEAQAESDRLREESAELLASRTRDAEAVATELRADAEADAQRVSERAAADAERTRGGAAEAAAAELDAAKTAGREMVVESRAVRERVLGDLDKRRELLQAQVDELRRGRDRLLDAYRVVKDTLGDATDALAQVEVRASSELGHFETTGPHPVVAAEYGPESSDDADDDTNAPAPADGGVLADDTNAETGEAGADGPFDVEARAPEPQPDLVDAPPGGGPESSVVSIAVGEAPESLRIVESDSEAESDAAPDEPGSAGTFEPAASAAPDAVTIAADAVTEAAEPARRPGLRGYLRSTLGYEPDAVVDADEQPTAELAAGSAGSTAVVPAPDAAEPEPEAVAEPDAGAASSSAAAPVDGTEGDDTDAGDAGGQDESSEPRDVGALFARLRADAASGGAVAAAAAAEVAPEPVVLHEVTIDDLTVLVTADAEPTAAEVDDGADGTGATGPSSGASESRPVQARAARDLALTKVGRDLARRAKRTLQDDQNALLDALRTRRGRPVADKVLPTVAEQIEVWTTVLSDAVHAAFAAGYATVDDPADSELPVGLAAELAEALVLPLRERLVPAISGDSSEMDDDDDIAGRVSARFREWKNQNLENALGDGLAVAYARGVYEAAPAGSLLEWVPAVVGRCPDCDDNALEPTVRGQCFPTGQPFPPAHPGCRCLLMVATSSPLVGVDAGRSADR